MFGWIRHFVGGRRRETFGAAHVRVIRAKFDSAQTTPDNRRHWANADALSADAAANREVRRTLRNRARYEVANNSYARGIVLTLANDVIGTGPRLQMLTDSAETNRTVEREFIAWAKAVGLPEKLRTMRMARAQDGEAFGILFTNDRLLSPVKLDLKLVEADQVTTPDLSPMATANAVDGILFDAFGNPQEYHVLKNHPGGGRVAFSRDYDRVPADSMIHWFRADRPGQSRGLPDIMPALPLFADQRDFTLSVVKAARSAADISLVMKTTAPPGGESAEVEKGAALEIELDRNTAIFAPEGWEPTQIKAEQPATTYDMFQRTLLNEIARCLNMPYNIAACNSSGYNYASGRLDHQTYYKSIRVEQGHCEAVVLDRILWAWLAEAANVFGLGDLEDVSHQWFWDGHEHVDPAKEASAQAQRLSSNTTTLAIEYARQGLDWEEQLRQRAKEVALMNELGLSPAQAQPAQPQPTKDNPDEGDPQDEEDGRAAA
ncbi:MAG: hypothetical protein BIFFINMI_03835 [Phycisphaerae bacterium]|nr:hypothetical protein [Phycisphaerae bacterium]